MPKPIIISDPFPRTLKLILDKEKYKLLKKKYNIITPPINKKNAFYFHCFSLELQHNFVIKIL